MSIPKFYEWNRRRGGGTDGEWRYAWHDETKARDLNYLLVETTKTKTVFMSKALYSVVKTYANDNNMAHVHSKKPRCITTIKVNENDDEGLIEDDDLWNDRRQRFLTETAKIEARKKAEWIYVIVVIPGSCNWTLTIDDIIKERMSFDVSNRQSTNDSHHTYIDRRHSLFVFFFRNKQIWFIILTDDQIHWHTWSIDRYNGLFDQLFFFTTTT